MKTSLGIRSVIATIGLVTASLFSQQVAPPEIAELQAKYDDRVSLDVLRPHDLALVELNTKFAAALDRAQEAAQKAGALEEAFAIKTEKEAVLSGKYSPAADDPTTSTNLKTLHATYRNALARLELDRDKKHRPLKERFAKSLEAVILTMTKSGRLEEAMALKKIREDLLANTVVSGTDARIGANTIQGPNGRPVTNSLGMKFVQVPDTNVLFCIHETRRQDYATYAAEVTNVDGAWKTQMLEGIPCGDKDDHPVVGVSWEDAVKFCEWLSKKEGKTYRLPTDREWSCAVGLGRVEKWTKDTTPEMLSEKEQNKFPWDGDYPPQTRDKAGNYADIAWHEKFPTRPYTIMADLSDGFATTAPVMNFKPNKLGIYDMGGNVWEWVGDWWNAAQKERVLRGASFTTSGHGPLLSSQRPHHPSPTSGGSNTGFRVVLEGASITASKTTANAVKDLPMKWEYFSQPSMQVVNGELELNKDGSLFLISVPNREYRTPGTYKPTTIPNVYSVVLLPINKEPENCILHLGTDTGRLERPIGTRYLKAIK